jgi:hypothetical protein
MDANYVLTVETQKENESKHVHISTRDFLMVKKDSEYIIQAHNKSEHICVVWIWIGMRCVGHWNLPRRSTLTIDSLEEYERELKCKASGNASCLRFGEEFWHIDNGLPKPIDSPYAGAVTQLRSSDMVCTQSSITALFTSEFGENITITIPIVLCDHTL